MLIISNRSIPWPVKVALPVKGEFVESEFWLSFRALSNDEYERIAKTHPLPERVEDESNNVFLQRLAVAMASMLAEVIDGWEDVYDEQTNRPLPWSRDSFVKMFSTGPHALRICRAANEALAEVRFGQKN